MGTENALAMPNGSFETSGGVNPFDFSDGTNAAGIESNPAGESIHTSFVVYDSLGTPLTLRFTVVNATTCKPIPNAAVELWHADAAGVYSGVSGNSGNFLRGIQRTNAKGQVRFETIFPGWYRGRTPHIHVKVHVGGREVHTGQLFFDEAVTDAVYAREPYAARGTRNTTNADDQIFVSAGGASTLSLAARGPTYWGKKTLVVET